MSRQGRGTGAGVDTGDKHRPAASTDLGQAQSESRAMEALAAAHLPAAVLRRTRRDPAGSVRQHPVPDLPASPGSPATAMPFVSLAGCSAAAGWPLRRMEETPPHRRLPTRAAIAALRRPARAHGGAHGTASNTSSGARDGSSAGAWI